MRIVGGTWAGVSLASPGARVRPTQEDLRAVWMDELATFLPGARVLDLFAGSGAVGLEAISRGAAAADFVENGSAALHALKANLARMRVKERTRLFKRDVFVFLQKVPQLKYDLAFADPPYNSRLAERLVTLWRQRFFSRILSVEHPASRTLPGKGVRHVFGDSAITTFRAPPNPTLAAKGASVPNGENGSRN